VGALAAIPHGKLRYVALPALAVYLLAWLPFLLVGDPSEMVDLQLAGSETEARAIVAGWSPDEALDIAFLLGVDNVHLLTYSIALAVGAVWAGRRFRGRAARWAPALSYMAFAAAAFDVLENIASISMVRGYFDAPVPASAKVFMIAKSLLLLIVVGYVAAGRLSRGHHLADGVTS
jgi:hypothetical protein